MRNRKSHVNMRLTDTNKTWQGWEVGNQTFDQELDATDVQEIRESLDDSRTFEFNTDIIL